MAKKIILRKEEIEGIRNVYLQGKTIEYTSKITGFSPTLVYKFIKDITRRRGCPKGNLPWNKGKNMPEHCGFQKGNIPWHKGKRGLTIAWNKGLTKETDERVKKASENKERIEKIRNTLKGRIPHNKGKTKYIYKPSMDNSIRMSKLRGKETPNWQGGKSFEKYPMEWTETLKRSIRERDYYTCQLCGKQQTGMTHNVHHINYDKKNCNPINLIVLCHSCHLKTNTNRKKWTKHFQLKMEMKQWL